MSPQALLLAGALAWFGTGLIGGSVGLYLDFHRDTLLRALARSLLDRPLYRRLALLVPAVLIGVLAGVLAGPFSLTPITFSRPPR